MNRTINMDRVLLKPEITKEIIVGIMDWFEKQEVVCRDLCLDGLWTALHHLEVRIGQKELEKN